MKRTKQEGPQEIRVTLDPLSHIKNESMPLGKILGIPKANKGIIAEPCKVPRMSQTDDYHGGKQDTAKAARNRSAQSIAKVPLNNH